MSDLFQELHKKYPLMLNQKMYCEITGKSAATAEQDRIYGRGCPFVRMNRSIRYPLNDVVSWLESLPRYSSTTEADAGKGHERG